MLLLVQSQTGGDLGKVQVGDRILAIGRDEQSEVRLPSPFVSHHHASLVPERGRLFLESRGYNPTLLNGRELKPGERVEVRAGDTIFIQGYMLALRAEDSRQPASREEIEARVRFTKLVERIHDAIIRRLDPREVKLATLDTEEGQRRANEALAAELDQLSLADEAPVVRWAAREALRTGALEMLLGSSSVVPLEGSGHAGGAYGSHEQARTALIHAIMEELAIAPDRSAAKEGIRRLRTGFDAAYEKRRFEIGPGLADHLCRWFLRKEIADLMFGLGPLTDLTRMPDVNEIMVVSQDQIYIEKDGAIEETGRTFVSEQVTERIIERIVAPVGRRVDRSMPMVDTRLKDGSRVNAVIRPLALKGPCLTIRRFSKEPFTIDDLIERGTMERRAAAFLKACVRGRKNLIVSGGTGSGKTTLLNALSGWIPANERIVTIEDNAELRLLQRHVVTLEARPANIQGRGEITIRDLVRNALRMRPDRIIVGECRGREALDMLQAMNTGHDGSMTTGHANSPADMMQRLQVMVLEAAEIPVAAIRQQIAAALHLVVQQARLADGARRVTHITDVVGFDEEQGDVITEDVFSLRADGELAFTGYLPTFAEELVAGGHLDAEEVFF